MAVANAGVNPAAAKSYPQLTQNTKGYKIEMLKALIFIREQSRNQTPKPSTVRGFGVY